jgi:hypothetical protein
MADEPNRIESARVIVLMVIIFLACAVWAVLT